jgi:NAD(P)-dependent dehydrogenase (short-subunit alcohol dehydrogenase family)
MIKEQFDLTGKTALVVGGRGFLGRRFCAALREFGADVIAADQPSLSYAAQADAGGADLLQGIEQRDVDVTNPASVQALADDILKAKRRVDVLVYSVTAKPKDFYAPFTECSLEGWQTVFRAEMDGLFLVTQAVGKAMEATGHGSVILLSSMYGVVGNDQRIYEGSNLAQLYAGAESAPNRQVYSHAAYPAVKGGVIALTRFLAAYWQGRNIRVNCVSPGGIGHPGENEEFVRRYSAKVPLGRKAKPDEISGAVVYLASEASSYVNGQNLIVDGGWTAW